MTENVKPNISIVLPAYNPPKGWTNKVIERMKLLQSYYTHKHIELIIVNDGSARWDNVEATTLVSSIAHSIIYTHPENAGKGQALRTGVSKATGDIIVMTDIDWPYTHLSVIDIIASLLDGNDVALGHRDETYYTNMPRARRLISHALRRLNRRMLNLPTDDTQCGLKGMRAPAKALFMKTRINRYLFDLEFIKILSYHKQLRISIIPVELCEGVVFTTMHLPVLIKESVNFMKILWSGKK